MMEQNNTWRCKDLYLAAFVYSQGKELMKVEREGKTCWFVFANPNAHCEELQAAYWANRGQTPPKVFADAVRSLKDLIFAG